MPLDLLDFVGADTYDLDRLTPLLGQRSTKNFRSNDFGSRDLMSSERSPRSVSSMIRSIERMTYSNKEELRERISREVNMELTF